MEVRCRLASPSGEIIETPITTNFRVPGRAVSAVAVSGIGDVSANVLYLVATQHGSLAITGVLGSLYPATTVVLATTSSSTNAIGPDSVSATI